MDPNTFPTKGNLILAKNSLALSRQGFDLMDKKRNILIRELMELIDQLHQNGIGAILDFVEQMAVRHHKKYVRLDCSIDNPELNTYYEKRGYHLAGQCQEGPYIGNRRQKAVEQS